MSIKDLEEAARNAAIAHNAADAARAAKERQLKSIEHARIEALMAAEFGATIEQLWQTRHAADMAVLAAREARALAGEGAPYPLGTRMVEWEWVPRGSALRMVNGRIGIFEAVTSASEHPGNLASYSMAKIGDYVIRLLKKDGARSLQYVTMGWDMRNRWRPEGVDINAEKKA